MRYKKGHKEETRRTILDAAGRSFRELGYQAGSVDKVMNAAGLTAGGFYAHFKSKDDLFAQVLHDSLNQLAINMEERLKDARGVAWVREFVRIYLSKAHYQRRHEGCPLPALLSELSRTGDETRKVFADFYDNRVEVLASHLAEDGVRESKQHASSLLCLCIGTMSIARSMANAELAETVLASARKTADEILERLPSNE